MSIEIVMCIVTYQRPMGLRRCLHALASLELPSDPCTRLRVLIVDNTPDGSARAVTDAIAATFPWPLEYIVEPRRGIPFARNCAVSHANGADLIGFIDDDEEVSPTWLVEMMKVWKTTHADVLMGPSVPRFDPQVARWVIEGRFFERDRFPTGEPFSFHYARTSGVLIAPSALPDRAAPFDVRFRYSGGSDQYLFRELHRAGRRFVWVDEAVVEEAVPSSRATIGWLMRRSYRIANVDSWALVLDGATAARRLRRVAGGLRATVIGLLAVIGALPRGRVAVVNALRKVATGIGLITGAFGVPYREYLRIHGG